MAHDPHPRTLVIIPAYNEADSIAGVVASIRQHAPWADVAVINDGSTDATGALAEAAGAVVLHLPHNVGIGASVQTGYIYAERAGYDVVVRSDGDGQHTPADIERLLCALDEHRADLVIGSRYLERRGYNGSAARRAGSLLLAGLISAIIGQRITDPTSGFTAANRRAIRLCARAYPYDYPEPEAIVTLRRAGLTLVEIPVTMRLRQGGRSSITSLRSAYYMAKVTLAILIGLLRAAPAEPPNGEGQP
ncbi:MAG: glycosyltransferase family 2 protein [Aggregatilineales bacterium]